jgi:hypothetical protein
VSLTLVKAAAFMVSEIVTLNPDGTGEYNHEFNPYTLNLGSVKETFATASEPAAMAILLTGLGGIALVRRRGG